MPVMVLRWTFGSLFLYIAVLCLELDEEAVCRPHEQPWPSEPGSQPGTSATCQGGGCGSVRLRQFREWRLTSPSPLLKLPVDPERRNFIRQVPKAIFSLVSPTPLSSPPMLAVVASDSLAGLLDLDPSDCLSSQRFLEFTAGSWHPPAALHLAHRYGGHQFGMWAGQLGDGRAVLLGEYVNLRGQRWELQLKGSGKTPYSRRGDGRAVLRSSIREFLASEAMFHLGVPTSRAASLVVSEEQVWRDQFYDGHPRQEKTAVLLRVAPSWFRIGSLEILHHSKEHDLLRQLVDVILELHFPHLIGPMRYHRLFSTMVNMTARLVAHWQAVGFAHGVCNTDNFSLLGITIDYGPFGFMDSYDADYVPNTSDDEGRYSFSNQPHIGLYNSQKLVEAMSYLLQEDMELALSALYSYSTVFNEEYLKLLRQKLGLATEDERDETLIVQLLDLMQATRADYTMTFREMTEISVSELKVGALPTSYWALPKLSRHPQWPKWVILYASRVYSNHPVPSYSEGIRMQKMKSANPRYILRNYMAETAIQLAELSDFSEVHRLHRVLTRPFERQSEAEAAGYPHPPPQWAQKLKVSCSS